MLPITFTVPLLSLYRNFNARAYTESVIKKLKEIKNE
jgi:hypothetical protein